MRDPAATGQPSPVEQSSSPPCGAPPSILPEPLRYGFLSLSLFQVSSHLCDFASVPDAVTRHECLTPPTSPTLLYLFLLSSPVLPFFLSLSYFLILRFYTISQLVNLFFFIQYLFHCFFYLLSFFVFVF